MNIEQKLTKSDYNFDLPEELIAQTPIENRSQSRLLIFDNTKSSSENTKQYKKYDAENLVLKDKKTEELCENISHKHFFDIVNYLKKGDVLIINEAKVAPVRLYGTKIGGEAKCEVLLIKRIDETKWETLVKPGKRLKTGCEIFFGDKLTGKIVSDTDFGGKVIEFKFTGIFEEILNQIGEMPLPHYIKSKLIEKERYNTVYAKVYGSAAAPTAGLHFTKELLTQLENKGVIIKKVLLNVSIGTFRPVKEDNILKHDMHSETYEISQDTANAINLAKLEGRRVIAVGTTSMRTLEASAAKNGKVVEEESATNIFIHNNYEFKVVDCLITNFHLPESTLTMLVAAFIGYDNFKKVYKSAIDNKYKFFSFGDACFFINKQ